MRLIYSCVAILLSGSPLVLAQELPATPPSCPVFQNGDVSLVPQKLGKARKAKVWLAPEHAGRGGPLVFFYHGMGASVDDAVPVLTQAVIDSITQAGGMVVAPYSEGLTFEWHLVLGTASNDLYLMDDLTACAVQEFGVNPERIYLAGFSAGALNASQMIYHRSGYVAAAVIYSGGFLTFRGEPTSQVPEHKFPVLLYHGGPDNNAFVNFEQTTRKMSQRLSNDNHYHVVCNHGKGHKIPDQGELAFSWQFLAAQTYGQSHQVTPPDYCQN